MYTKEDIVVNKWQYDTMGIKEGDLVSVGSGPFEVLKNAKNKDYKWRRLIRADWNYDMPFFVKDTYDFIEHGYCIIKKKDELIPFDLQAEEDRKALRGRWVAESCNPEYEYMIISLNNDSVILYGGGVCCVDSYSISTSTLLSDYIFVDGDDKGKPVGKES